MRSSANCCVNVETRSRSTSKPVCTRSRAAQAGDVGGSAHAGPSEQRSWLPRWFSPSCSWGVPSVTQLRQTPVATTDPSEITLPDGNYRYRLTPHELRAASGGRISQQEIRNNAGTWTWKVHDGHWSLHLNPSAPTAAPPFPCSGTLTLTGNLATFVRTVNHDPAGDCVPPKWSAQYTFERGVALWSAVSVPDFGWFFAPEPWVLH